MTDSTHPTFTETDNAVLAVQPAADPPTAPAASDQESTPADILPAAHWTQGPHLAVEDDADSTLGDDVASSTASLSSTVLQYRTVHGRTFANQIGHSDAWGPNDQRHLESFDINHYLILLSLKDNLYLSPLDKDSVKKVVDIGAGSGAWAIDFADEFPAAQIIGTDVSPTQPAVVPPNLRFEIDDANQEWTWPENTFDFIHMSNMTGCLVDWLAVYRNAYRCCKPGAWFEDFETSTVFSSDDGTVLPDSPMDQWSKVFAAAGKKFGRTFSVIEEQLQTKYITEAGFVETRSFDFKCPFGTWALDSNLKVIGNVARHVLDMDLEGYTLYLWSTVMGWTKEEVYVYVSQLRRQLRDPKIHAYTRMRVVYGRKPLDAKTL